MRPATLPASKRQPVSTLVAQGLLSGSGICSSPISCRSVSISSAKVAGRNGQSRATSTSARCPSAGLYSALIAALSVVEISFWVQRREGRQRDPNRHFLCGRVGEMLCRRVTSTIPDDTSLRTSPE